MMKRIILTILSGIAVLGCVTEKDLAVLQKQIDDINSNQIASINDQVSSIQNSISQLEITDSELLAYIKTLEEQLGNLENTDQILTQSILELKTELYSAVSNEKAELWAELLRTHSEDSTAISNLEIELRSLLKDSENNVLSQLDAYKASVNGQISSITAAIAELQAKDRDLQKQIGNLKSYIDGEINGCKDWATATFVTLEQYNTTAGIVAGIQVQLSSINEKIQQLSNTQGSWVTQDELNESISSLDASLQSKIQTAIDNCNSALNTAKQEITSAYTKAIQEAISSCENSIKSWVNQQLSGYYTIAQTDAKITALKTDFEGKLNSQKSYLEGLITTLESTLNKKISNNETLIESLQGQINSLNTEVSTLAGNVATNARNIAKNAEDILANAKNISANATSIESCQNLIAANKRLIEENTTAIEANATSIAELQERATSDETIIKANTTAIAKNAEDIATNAGLIAANANAISNNAEAISNNAADIAQLRSDLNTAKTEITEAYQQAIKSAINTLDGKLSGQIASEVSTINTRITDEIASVNATIDALTTRVEKCESDIKSIKTSIYNMQIEISDIQDQIADILSRIQSISYVPKYSDGSAVMYYTANGKITPGSAVFDFELYPASTAAALVEVWQSALSMKAVYTQTKSSANFVGLPITSVTSEEGILTVTVSGANMSEAFFLGQVSASARLYISDGSNERASEYIKITPWTTDVISVPDANFKAYLLENFDSNSDGEISYDEGKTITAIDISNYSPAISSLSGIEYFSNLETLDCSYNKISSLDLGNNTALTTLNVSNNVLTYLNISGLSAITSIDVSSNKLTSLGVSSAKTLTTLACSNNQLGELVLLNNKALTYLQCSGNKLGKLDLSNQADLTELYCRSNNLTSLIIEKCPLLTIVDCSNNSLTSLNLSNNTLIQNLYCYSNSLSSLHLGAAKALTNLNCSKNALTSLNLFDCTNIETLNCSTNSLSSLDVSTLKKLNTLNCATNNFASLDISTLPELTTLNCTSDKLLKLWLKNTDQQETVAITKHSNTNLFFNNGGIHIPDPNFKSYIITNYDEDGDGEISPVEAEYITSINCSGKSISDLTGVEAFTNLSYLNCSNNSLQKLDLHTLTKLETLNCYGNQLSEINLNNCAALRSFYIYDSSTNVYNADATNGAWINIKSYSQASSIKFSMDVIKYRICIQASPNLKSVDLSENVCKDIVVNNNTAMTSVKLPSTIQYYYGYSCALESIDLFNCPDLKYLQIYSNKLTALDVSQNPKLIEIQAWSNELTALDLSNNPKMNILRVALNKLTSINLLTNTLITGIDLNSNSLTSINVRTLSKLKDLYIHNNPAITDVNVTNNPLLVNLNVSGTSITSLDISKNTELTSLNATGTGITFLDVSKNAELASLKLYGTTITSIDVSKNTKITQVTAPIGCYIKTTSMGGIVFQSSSESTKIVSVSRTTAMYCKVTISNVATDSNDGSKNMDKIIAGISGYPAFKWCYDIASDWYLPAKNEMKAIYDNKAKINSALSSLNATPFETGTYWTSTGTANATAYAINFSTGNISSEQKTNTYYVRAVRKF